MPHAPPTDAQAPLPTREEFRESLALTSGASTRAAWLHVVSLLPVWLLAVFLKVDAKFARTHAGRHFFTHASTRLALSLGSLAVTVGSVVLLRRYVRGLKRRHRLFCPGCGRDLSGDESAEVLATDRCGRCRARVLRPSEPRGREPDDRELPALADLSARAGRMLREMRRDQRVSFAWMAVAFVVLGVAATQRPLLPAWAEWVGIGGFLATLVLSMAWDVWRGRGRAARYGMLCPRCGESLHSHATVLERTGKCGSCGSTVVRDRLVA